MEQMNNENFDVTTNEEIVQESTVTVEQSADTKDGLCVASLILGIVGFFINPVYICSILAIVFGAIGMKANGVNAGKAKIGLILGIVAIIVQFVLDIIITIFTMGAGGVSFCC